MSRCASKQATKNRLGPVQSESGTPDGQRPEVLECFPIRVGLSS